MGLPRSRYVKDGEEGVYHCFSRCVRRAFLCGYDPLTKRDFSHRKKLILDRLRYLAAVFAIEVCAYAILENHLHNILRTRPDIVANWTDMEVATRWLTLFPGHRAIGGATALPTEEEIQALASRPERIALLRQRLCSLSWFMGRLNEYIARVANKEDGVKGRFWESRFKCQSLLDVAAITTCMVYVDLNLIRAGVAATPEESDFTSIQERIRAWKKETMAADTAATQADRDIHSGNPCIHGVLPEHDGDIPEPASKHISAMDTSLDIRTLSDCWLCPISSDSKRRGILEITAAEYFDLVDRSGRMLWPDKRGAIDADLAPILIRIGAKPDAWIETVSHFGSKFCLAAGLLSSLRDFADQVGRRWLKGVGMARIAFAS